MRKIYLLFALLMLSLFAQSQTVYQWYQDGVVIFQLKTNSKYIIPSNEYRVNLSDVDFLAKVRSKYGITEISRILYYHPDEKLNNTYQVNFTEMYKVEELIADIAKQPFIEYAEKKELHVKFLTPIDLGSNATSNNNSNSTTSTNQWHLWNMRAQQAWDLSTGSANIVVAVTDDAIRTTHQDLTGKFVAGYDATTQGSDPNPCGSNDGNHGTHVAGTVGARTNNGSLGEGAGTPIGVASIGWNVSIMPVKIGRCSDGALTRGYEGIAWAANNGAHVINMSWGGGGQSNFGLNTVNAAFNQGAILVAAAGNDGTTQQFFPAAYANVIAVASIQFDNSRSSFSQHGTWINISAPGSAIRSTWATSNTAYNRIQGTSMASPNVAGLLGLMRSYAPNASRDDLINCLYSSAAAVTTNPGQMGAGRIDAFAALQCLQAFTFQTDAGITDIVAPPATVCGSTFTPQVTLRNFGSNPITAVAINYTWGTVNANFNWTGNLASGQSTTVSLPLQTAGTSGNFTFTATANLAGDQNASNNSTSRAFSVDPNGQVTNLTLITDCYGSEITWNIRNSSNAIVASGGPYTNVSGGQTFNFANCLPVGCYTFTINDSYGDGLFGSQWQNCSVNGNYFMTGANGASLFEMTAPNGNFGNTASHNFCINPPNLNNDAGITEVISPSGTVCAGTVSPQVRIRNFGNNNLTSVIINYNTGGTNQTFNWSGNLTTGQTAVVNLPAIAASTGVVTLTAFTTQPNGVADQNTSNDQSQRSFNVYATGLDLPFTESFESNSFATNLWQLENPDNDVTWDIVTVGGITPGNRAARMNFFNYTQASQRDGLITPLLNLNGYQSATLNFDHAYRRFIVQGSTQPAPTDSIVVYVSTNCGSNWQRVFQSGENGNGSFATTTASNQAFTPSQASDWCFQQVLVNGNLVGSLCYQIDLTPFVGNQILIKFEGLNAGTQGNNLFIDNINIDGVPLPFNADFTASTQSVCPGQQVTFTDASAGTVTSRSWSFPGGSPATSTALNPTVTYNTPGTYNVSLTITGPSGTDTETKTGFITVHSNPTATVTGNANLCSGGSTLLTANATAGSGTITSYQWTRNNTNISGATSATFSANQTGTYRVVVTNSFGCSVTSSGFSVTAASNPTVNITGNSAFCTGGNTLLTANATAGTGTVSTFQWRRNGTNISGATSSTFTATQAGTYTVVVTNSAGCTTTSANFSVTVNANPTVSIAGSTTVCSSGTTLTANATAGSGTIASYQWRLNGTNINGATSSTVTATQGGTYTVVVTNSNGCSTTSNAFNATLSPSFNINVVTTDANCGQANGAASASANGVTSGFSFSWNTNPVSSGPTVSGLAFGSYTVTVTQTSTGCVQTQTFVVGNIGQPTIEEIATTQATCFNGSVGTAVATVSGGDGNYTYNWGNGPQSSASAENLPAGNYTLIVSDGLGCQTLQNFTIESNDAPELEIVATQSATCQTLADGSAEVNVSGGSGNYTFEWSNGSNSQNLENAPAGNYTLTVDDANGCSSEITVSIGNSYFMGLELLVTDNSATQGNSSITVVASGGTEPYSYNWNNGEYDEAFIENLASGEYIVIVSDANGCAVTDTAYIGTVSIADVNLIELIRLYPNPAQTEMQLDLMLTGKADVMLSVYNPIGQILWKKMLTNFSEGSEKIPVQQLASGAYFLSISANGNIKIVSFNKID